MSKVVIMMGSASDRPVTDKAENILTRHQNEKSDIEEKIKMLENEITDLIESLPKHIKSIQSKLNEISAVQYSIKPE